MLQGRSLGSSIRHVRVEVAKSIGIPGDLLSDLKCYLLLYLCLCLCSVYGSLHARDFSIDFLGCFFEVWLRNIEQCLQQHT